MNAWGFKPRGGLGPEGRADVESAKAPRRKGEGKDKQVRRERLSQVRKRD